MKTIMGWSFWVLVVLAVFGVLRQAKAEPVVSAEGGGIRVTVYTEDCAFTGVVANLPKRATWTENGKTVEGCAGAFPGGVVLLYFSDKTVVAIPAAMFQRVQET